LPLRRLPPLRCRDSDLPTKLAQHCASAMFSSRCLASPSRTIDPARCRLPQCTHALGAALTAAARPNSSARTTEQGQPCKDKAAQLAATFARQPLPPPAVPYHYSTHVRLAQCSLRTHTRVRPLLVPCAPMCKRHTIARFLPLCPPIKGEGLDLLFTTVATATASPVSATTVHHRHDVSLPPILLA
jgi:hypothetical protein